MNSDKIKELGTDIATYFRNERAARSAKEVLQMPEILTRENRKPGDADLRRAADSWYVDQLMKRRELTPAETTYLAKSIGKFLKDGDE